MACPKQQILDRCTKVAGSVIIAPFPHRWDQCLQGLNDLCGGVLQAVDLESALIKAVDEIFIAPVATALLEERLKPRSAPRGFANSS